MFITRSYTAKSVESSNPLASFLAEGARPVKFIKPVYFYRLSGIPGTDEEYSEMIRQIDEVLHTEYPQLPYLRLSQQDLRTDSTGLGQYIEAYDGWSATLSLSQEEQLAYRLPVHFNDDTLEWTFKKAYQQAMRVYEKEALQTTASMVRNFGVKLLSWTAKYLPRLFVRKAPDVFPKIVYVGKIRPQESLFLYLLALMGGDVLYFNPEGDIASYPTVLAFARPHVLGSCRSCALQIPSTVNKVAPPAPAYIPRQPIPAAAGATVPRQPDPPRPVPQVPAVQPGVKRSYEELARLSTSVVMIGVFDRDNNCVKTGSGVVVNGEGYVLTNFHVISGGHHYKLRFENEQDEYDTETLVKYHPEYDLALLRIDKACEPIPVIRDGGLVRGQQVVAIGSPLGLFNSVSEGIISGFRQIDAMSMVQVTAPVSSGSSGGALLDLYGQLIGIITAGYDNGQNLNLAVDYNTIRMFAGNFLR